MELMELFQPGIQREEVFDVEEKHSAMHIGSGAARVLATPWMIAFMERSCHQLLEEKLPSGFSSVGTVVNIRHLAPTAVGKKVTVHAEIVSIDGMKILFNVQVLEGQKTVGTGQHERFVIDEERFLKKISGE